MKLFGLDRTKRYDVPGALVDEWTREIEEVSRRLRAELTCPNCGGLMVYGTPCGPAPQSGEGRDE
jgi:hypothetical protein